MLSIDENFALSDGSKNIMYYTNSIQKLADQSTQSFYSDSSTQSCKPKYEQIELEDLSSSSSTEASMFPTFGSHSETFTHNLTDEKGSSMIFKTEYFLQEFSPTSLAVQVSNFYPVIESSTKVKSENFVNGVDSFKYMPSLKIKTENFADVLDYMRSNSPFGQYQINNLDSTSTSKEQLDSKSSLYPIKSESSLEDPTKLRDLSVSRKNEEQKSRRIKCKCPNCNAGAGKKVRDVNGRLVHRCHVSHCGREFSTTTILKRHLDWHSGKKKFVCAQCNKKFLQKDTLNRHIITHMDEARQHTCHIANCGKGFKRIDHLKRHLITHKSNKKFVCHHCNNEFKYKESLITHIKKHMNIMANESKASDNGQFKQIRKQTKCKRPNCSVEGGKKTRDSDGELQHVCHYPDCKRVFNKSSRLKSHLISHTGEKNVVCTHCNKEFMRRKYLIRHLERHWNIMSNEPNGSVNGKFKQLRKWERCQCPNCCVDGGNKTRDPNGRLLHACHHLNCRKVFNNTGGLKYHLAWHRGEKNFLCTECNRKFVRRSNLMTHMKIHASVRAQNVSRIPDCGRDFSTSSYLKRHTVDKNLVCPHCNKEFARKNTFTAHIRTHMTVK